MCSDRAAMQSLARTRSSLEITLKGHTADLTKQMKQVNGIEKLYENYQANPQFGSADSVYAELSVIPVGCATLLWRLMGVNSAGTKIAASFGIYKLLFSEIKL